MLKNDKSLLRRIKEAETLDRISKLLEEGRSYAYASQGTRNRWVRHATSRAKELEAGK